MSLYSDYHANPLPPKKQHESAKNGNITVSSLYAYKTIIFLWKYKHLSMIKYINVNVRMGSDMMQMLNGMPILLRIKFCIKVWFLFKTFSKNIFLLTIKENALVKYAQPFTGFLSDISLPRCNNRGFFHKSLTTLYT